MSAPVTGDPVTAAAALVEITLAGEFV